MNLVKFLFFIINGLYVYGNVPVAIPNLVCLNSSSNIVIRLSGYDLTGNGLSYRISRTPIYGELYQLSHVYSHFGYNPISGARIYTNDFINSVSKQRLYYSIPYNILSKCSNQYVESFSFIVDNGGEISYETNITIVNNDGTVICSDFLLSLDGWTIVGNKRLIENPAFEPYSRGLYLNHYICSSDDKINVDKYGDSDKSLWFFNAPSKFLGNMGIAYGGFIMFSLELFSGDIRQLNYGINYNLIELESTGFGITVVYPFINFNKMMDIFQVPLRETKGWYYYKTQKTPSKCDFIRVLSDLSAIRILGDITTWYETVALDNVFIINKQNNIPRCAVLRTVGGTICDC